MELSGLSQLIKYLERGTKLHIGVVFLGNFGNSKCALPHESTIHISEVCDSFKRIPKEFDRCLRCRNLAIRRAVRDRRAFAALCINGVYEYTRPVILHDRVVAVIFIGNILTEEGLKKLCHRGVAEGVAEAAMERGISDADLEEMGALIDGYILQLIENYPDGKGVDNPIIQNVKEYVYSNIAYDLSLSAVARFYFYNEVYLGRLFKETVGLSFKEFVNRERIKRAGELLSSDLPITEVAERVGYNNITYFNRVFKLYTGMTPGEYRRNI